MLAIDMATNETRRAQMTDAGLNLIQQALTIYDSDLCLVVSNRPFAEMFALPKPLTTPGARFADTIRFLAQRGDYGDVGNLEEWVTSRVQTAEAFEPHYMERTRANGTTISVEGSPLPQGGWVTVYTDITAIKAQEALLSARSAELSDQVLTHAQKLSQTNRQLASTNAALEQAKKELTEIEARTRMTTEMMPAHIAHLGANGLYTYSNRRLPSVLPHGRPDIIGLTAREALGDEAYTQIKPYLEDARNGRASVFEFGLSDSTQRIRAAFTPDPQVENGVYILSMDVTEEAQARAAITQTGKRALAAQITSGLAHDFANLLTIILGMQSRLSRMPLPQEAQSLITATTNAARRGGTLLDRIAGISGGREVTPTPTDLTKFIADFKTLAAPSLPEHISLTIRADPLPQPLLLDAGSLQDSLINLILNARDAIADRPGSIEMRITTIGERWLEITTQDSGPGFSDKALTQALDPFFTTKGGEGTGLGLSMVYDLTKLAGGRTKLSNTDKGARVSLRLPLRIAPPLDPEKLVLLVEDDDDLRTTIREQLITLGHRVIEASSVDEAQALATLPEIGLILSDIHLGGPQTGLDLLDTLHRTGLSAQTRLMTSLPPPDPLRQQAAARYPLISKPFEAADLRAFLSQSCTP